MTEPAWITYLLTATNIALAAVVIIIGRLVQHRRREEAREYLEIIGHMRMLMEDLIRTDPVIAESLHIGLLELDRLETSTRRIAEQPRGWRTIWA